MYDFEVYEIREFVVVPGIITDIFKCDLKIVAVLYSNM